MKTTPKANETFEQWFKRMKFRNFSADEFTSYFNVKRRGTRNSAPPKSKWTNIVPALRIVDDLRDYFGRPCVINSSYRSEAYNKSCGGASKSLHKEFKALDISFSAVRPHDVRDKLIEWRREGRFKGGVGRYNTFTHIDTRGYNATWG